METPLDLDAIKARCEAASPGPWEHLDPAGIGRGWEVGFADGSLVTCDGDGTGSIESETDATFIAHAREDVPALVAEVERLRRELYPLSESR